PCLGSGLLSLPARRIIAATVEEERLDQFRSRTTFDKISDGTAEVSRRNLAVDGRLDAAMISNAIHRVVDARLVGKRFANFSCCLCLSLRQLCLQHRAAPAAA